MKREPAQLPKHPAQPQQQRLIWRVFEYRRPPVPVRPRFTT
jgi:hypothetical protein